jgi:predicted dehydrogenase
VEPVKLLIIGGGNRGALYAGYASTFPHRAKVVGVAEPREYYRRELQKSHNIPPENVSPSYHEFLERERFADAVVICTPDQLHYEPAIAFTKKGYHILLEKPMATTPQECREIVRVAEENKVIFSVCHVMRYTVYTQTLMAMLDEGVIGDIISMQHVEPVGYWHYAHSYVRGNWRNKKTSTFMLLAKSCHDLDWIQYVMKAKCVRVQSFGALSYFHPGNLPEGAANRCLDCQVEPTCPYSAKKIYLRRIEKRQIIGMIRVVDPNPTIDSITAALQDGPYGRCVYRCDNDVVDHQVVNMAFEGGQTASFTMVAFTRFAQRRTAIFGTLGELYGDGTKIEVYRFLDDSTETYPVPTGTGFMQGHGGGDLGLMDNFTQAILDKDPSLISSTPDEILWSHLLAFEAERSRNEARVVNLC